MKNIIIFHEKCSDGLVSAYLIYLAAKANNLENIVMHPGQYSDIPYKATKGDNIILVDFSYSLDVLNEYRNQGVNITIIDHHKTAIENIINPDKDTIEESLKLPYISNVSCTDDILNQSSIVNKDTEEAYFKYYFSLNDYGEKPDHLKHSGASLVYLLIRENIDINSNLEPLRDKLLELEPLVDLTRQYDLWLHDGEILSDVSYLNFFHKEFLYEHEKLFKNMKEFTDASEAFFEVMIKLYKSTTLEQKLAKGKELASKEYTKALEYCSLVNPILINGVDTGDAKIGLVAVKDKKDFNASLIGSLICRQFGYDIAVLLNIETDKENQIFSLRSIGEYNVTHIAKVLTDKEIAITGGGHKNSAGVVVAKDKVFFTYKKVYERI